MFAMEVLYLSASQAPIVLAQATRNTPALKPDYQSTVCQETEITGDINSAFRAVDPVTMLAIYIQNRDHRAIDFATRAAIQPTILEAPTHGKLIS